jgi:hypothetical protein
MRKRESQLVRDTVKTVTKIFHHPDSRFKFSGKLGKCLFPTGEKSANISIKVKTSSRTYGSD